MATLWEVAVHEAGHAVVADQWGMQIMRVTIEPTESYAGCMFWARTYEHRRCPSDVSLAGFAAEAVMLGSCTNTSPADIADVQLGEARRAWYEAYRLVREYRTAVSLFAERLMEERTVEWPMAVVLALPDWVKAAPGQKRRRAPRRKRRGILRRKRRRTPRREAPVAAATLGDMDDVPW